MVNFTALQILFDEETGEFRVLPQQNVQVGIYILLYTIWDESRISQL